MLYVQIKAHGAACHAQGEFPGNDEMRATDAANGYHWESRNDWKTIERAQAIAQQLNDASDIPTPYLATDAGPNCSPRFDVIKRPQEGDLVSKSFNGDAYPCGKVVSVSDSLRVVTTDTGVRFYRVRETGSWRANRTWYLCHGHISERNPSF